MGGFASDSPHANGKGNWRMLLKYVADNSHEFDQVDYSQAFMLLGRMFTYRRTIRSDDRFKAFLSEFEKKVRQAKEESGI